MTHRTITLADLAAGRVPDELEGIRWADGTVECRFNVTADDYFSRRREAGERDVGSGDVLTEPTDCDRCADKCSASTLLNP